MSVNENDLRDKRQDPYYKANALPPSGGGRPCEPGKDIEYSNILTLCSEIILAGMNRTALKGLTR